MEYEIIIKPNYTLKESLNFTFRNLFAKWNVKIVLLIATLILLIDLIHLFQISEIIIFPNGIPLFNILFPFIIFLIVPISIYLLLKKTIRNELNQQTHYIFNVDCFRIKKDLSDVKKPWNLYESILETKDYFLIKQNKYQTDFFPKRFFSEQQVIDFRELIKTLDIKKV
ncbi:YcxB family protein [Flavobacterium sp. Fl-318]|jgi:hypothetical protein|uniref:YcxB family protein n=1 Tax=Flavobacterium cupriresistens TaxID=2893885 RepID=A0ABU4RBK6_9FLAO|nr:MULTISPECIES: YcxB family protein [unclassified Flavobacterium]MDX6188860.1 YcxB family protein [Flavobacterium sp. Fl-318]UFH44357.1 YcxB family protein [Flavobacterium sp. F-323]